MYSYYKRFIYLLLLSLFSCSDENNLIIPENDLLPAPPNNFSIYRARDGEVFLIWDKASEPIIDGYKIFRGDNDSINFRLVAFVRGDYYIDDSLDYDVYYYYKAISVDSKGRESGPTNIVKAKPENVYPPYIYRRLEINARNWEDSVSIFLNWEPSYNTDTEGYFIYRSTSPGFEADSSALIGFTTGFNYSDGKDIEFYKDYFYKVRAVDKGGLIGNSTNEVVDKVHKIPELIFPADGASVPYFTNLKIKTLEIPARYRIIVQTNKYFGAIWSYDFYSSTVNTETDIYLNASIYPYTAYYWRIATFSEGIYYPNSVSKLYSFSVLP